MSSRFVCAALMLFAVSTLIGCSDDTGKGAQGAGSATPLSSSLSDGNARGPMSLEALSAALGLSSDQQTQLKAIREKYHDKRQELHTSFSQNMSKQDRFAAIKSMRDSMQAEVKAVLTADQFTKLTALRAQRFSEMKNRFGGTPEERLDHRLAFLTKQLDLTTDQQAKVRTALETASAQWKEQKNTTATPGSQDWASHRGMAMDAIRPILTPDQIQKLEQLKTNFQGWRKGGTPST